MNGSRGQAGWPFDVSVLSTMAQGSSIEMLIEEGMISPQDLELFEFADTAEQTWEILTRRGLRAHS
jgi:predicted Rossmann-fold nucleotide-binding protein